MTVLSVDPGKSSGWARWDDAGMLLDHGILHIDEMLELLSKWPPAWPVPRVVVYEQFVLDYRAAKQKGSSMEASQVIGALKLFARAAGAIAVPQSTSDAKVMGYVHAQLQKAGRHADSHDRDAVAHGWYWWESQRVQPSLGEHRHLRTTQIHTGVVSVIQ